MVISIGAVCAMHITDSIAKIIIPLPVTRKSNVGAGGSMVANMIFHLSLGKSLVESV